MSITTNTTRNGQLSSARGKTLNMAQREIITEGWEDYMAGKLSVSDIAQAAGVGYETVRYLLGEITKIKRVKPLSPREVSRRTNRGREQTAGGVKRPRGITAQPFTDDWFDQNQQNAERHFRACITSGHWQFFQAE